jgi:hypothetical protein
MSCSPSGSTRPSTNVSGDRKCVLRLRSHDALQQARLIVWMLVHR